MIPPDRDNPQPSPSFQLHSSSLVSRAQVQTPQRNPTPRIVTSVDLGERHSVNGLSGERAQANIAGGSASPGPDQLAASNAALSATEASLRSLSEQALMAVMQTSTSSQEAPATGPQSSAAEEGSDANRLGVSDGGTDGPGYSFMPMDTRLPPMSTVLGPQASSSPVPLCSCCDPPQPVSIPEGTVPTALMAGTVTGRDPQSPAYVQTARLSPVFRTDPPPRVDTQE